MKSRGKVDVQFHSLLVSTFDEDELLASRPGRFTCRKTTPLYTLKRWGPRFSTVVKELRYKSEGR